MKKAAKNLAFLFSVLMAASVATGCSSGPAGEDDAPSAAAVKAEETPVAEEEVPYLDTLEVVDMEGYSYRIVAQHLDQRPNFAFDEELTGEALNDAIHNRDTALKDRLNITIEEIGYEDRGLLKTDVAKVILAQDDAYDLILTAFSDGINTLATQNLLLDLTTVPQLSLDSQYWNRSIAQNMRFSGKQFFTSGPSSVSYFYVSTHMLVNRTLVKNLNLPNPQDLVLEGEWTVDAMASLVADAAMDLNGDGAMDLDNDQFAAIFGHTLGNEMFMAAGLHAVSYDEAEGWKVRIDEPTSIDFIQKCAAVFSDVDKTPNFGGTNETHYKVFTEGRCLLIDSIVGNTINFVRGMEDDFGVLPIPVLNEGDPYLCECNTWGPAGIAMPITATNLDRLGLIMETRAVYSYDYLTPAVVEKTLGKVSNSSIDYQILTMTFENGSFELNTIMDFGGSSTMLRGACFGVPENFVSSYAAIKKQTENALEEFIASVEKENS